MATPFSFKENPRYALYHGFRVFIFGVDVTPWLNTRVNIKYGDRDGLNVCSFTLSNASNVFVFTEDNRLGKYRLSGDVDSMYNYSNRYTEVAKKTIVDAKHSLIAVAYDVLLWSAQSSVNESVANGSIKLTQPDIKDSTKTTTGQITRYDFKVGSPVFHKQDPVRVFIKNPLSSDMNQWYCAFTGFIEAKPTSQSYTDGQSYVQITCHDARGVMQQMRVQANPFAHYSDAAVQVRNQSDTRKVKVGNQYKDLANGSNDGINMSDLTGTGNLSHPLANMNMFDSIQFLFHDRPLLTRGGSPINGTAQPQTRGQLLGKTESAYISDDQNVTHVNGPSGFGQFASTKPVFWNPANTSSTPEAKSLFLEDWNNLILFGPAKRFLTYPEMMNLGHQTRPDRGPGDPAVAVIRYLLPEDGLSITNMIEFDMANPSGLNVRVEWTSRYELLMTICKNVDYQFYVNGLGDFIFEFPMYDFKPSDFGNYQSIYEFKGHLVHDSINDEGGPMITSVRIESHGTTFTNVQNLAIKSGGAPVNTGQQLFTTIYSEALQSKLGGAEDVLFAPGVTSLDGLKTLAYVEFQKRMANYTTMDFESTYRPYLMVNRPVYNGVRQAFGIIKDVDNGWNLRQDATVHLALNFVRQTSEDGRAKFISGSESTPISYSKIYPSDSNLHKDKQGINSTNNQNTGPITTPVNSGDSNGQN